MACVARVRFRREFPLHPPHRRYTFPRLRVGKSLDRRNARELFALGMEVLAWFTIEHAIARWTSGGGDGAGPLNSKPGSFGPADHDDHPRRAARQGRFTR